MRFVPFPASASLPTTIPSSTPTAISPPGSTAPQRLHPALPPHRPPLRTTPATPKACSAPSPPSPPPSSALLTGLWHAPRRATHKMTPPLRRSITPQLTASRLAASPASSAFARRLSSGTSPSPSTKTSGPAPTSSLRRLVAPRPRPLYWLIDMPPRQRDPHGKASSGPGSSSAPTPSPPSSSPTSSSKSCSGSKSPTACRRPANPSPPGSGSTSHSSPATAPPNHLSSLRHRLRSRLLPPQLAPLAQTHLPQNLTALTEPDGVSSKARPLIARNLAELQVSKRWLQILH